jgi:hypothetical protein
MNRWIEGSENHMEDTDTAVPHRNHKTSPPETNRLLLFGETVAVYCEKHTEHRDPLRGQKIELLI